MFFFFVLCATLVGAATHLLRTPPAERTRQHVVETLLLYLLCVKWGFGGILGALRHILAPDWAADCIGWEKGSSFQIELGFASLGLSVLGALCVWLRGVFWLAPAIGFSIFRYAPPTCTSARLPRTATGRPATQGSHSFSI